MSATKQGLPQEQKNAEGRALRAAFERRQQDEPDLTQESLIYEMGLRSQGQFGQWCDGKTAIPDKRLLWLGQRLGFDPIEVRPSLSEYASVAEGVAAYAGATEKALDDEFERLSRAATPAARLRALRRFANSLPPGTAMAYARVFLDRAATGIAEP